MKKKVLVLGVLLLATLPLVAASSLPGHLGNIFDNYVLQAGNLTWLGLPTSTLLISFTRLLLAILVFTIFYGVMRTFGGNDGAFRFLNQNQSMVVAAVLAIISAIFLPDTILTAFGSAWATAVGAILIWGPVVGLAVILWTLPNNTRPQVFLKIVLCIILFWILSVIGHSLGAVVK